MAYIQRSTTKITMVIYTYTRTYIPIKHTHLSKQNKCKATNPPEVFVLGFVRSPKLAQSVWEEMTLVSAAEFPVWKSAETLILRAGE